ncbi:MAG: cell division ATPase MinD [Candidatus Pacearchaeota archaeon]
MAKVYAILSGKGGVGKTTSTINLGTALNHLGYDCIIVDSNLTTPNIGIHLGAPIVPITLNHVLNGQAEIEDAIYEHDSGTKIIPASLSLKETEKINYKKLVEISKKLKKIADYILMDSAAGLGEEARAAMQAADEIIVITNPEISAVTDALKTIKLAEELGKPALGVIITRYQGKKIDMPISNIRDMLEIPILGIIPEDTSIKESHILKNAVIHTHPKSDAARTYINTTKRLLGENIKIEPFINKSVLSKILIKIGIR